MVARAKSGSEKSVEAEKTEKVALKAKAAPKKKAEKIKKEISSEVVAEKNSKASKISKVSSTAGKKVCVIQIRSSIGCVRVQKESLKGLGLGRIGKKSILLDNPCTRGLINRVSHLVRVVDSNE